jgi:hypothetical protein
MIKTTQMNIDVQVFMLAIILKQTDNESIGSYRLLPLAANASLC